MGTRQHAVGRGSGGNGPFANVERCEGRSELSEVSRARTPSLWRRAHFRLGGHPDLKGTLGWVGARRPDRDFPGDTIAAVSGEARPATRVATHVCFTNTCFTDQTHM